MTLDDLMARIIQFKRMRPSVQEGIQGDGLCTTWFLMVPQEVHNHIFRTAYISKDVLCGGCLLFATMDVFVVLPSDAVVIPTFVPAGEAAADFVRAEEKRMMSYAGKTKFYRGFDVVEG